MKIAILISGYFRGFQQTKETIKNNITWDENHSYDFFIQHSNISNDNKYYNEEIKIKDIQVFFNPKIIICLEDMYFSEDKRKNNILNQNYKIYCLYKNMELYSKANNMNYDVILKIRPDVYLKNKLDFNNLDEIIYIPIDSKIDTSKLLKSNDKYVCDIIAYGKYQIMNKYLKYYKYLNLLITHYGTVNETLLYHYLINSRYPYTETNIDYFVVLSQCNTIAITGDSGSGKTTLSTIIKNVFESSVLLECDRYHKWERGNENWKDYTHLNPEANYITKMNSDVFDLKLGNNIYQVNYDHTHGKFTDKEYIESKENVIVCGLHSLYLKKNITNLRIYMDTDENIRIFWKMKRDMKKRGYSKEKVYESILNRKDDFNKYIYSQKSEADLIIHIYSENYIFNIDTFDESLIHNLKFKVGIKSTFKLNNIFDEFDCEIENLNNYVYLCFENIDNYEKTIINLLKLLKK
tara:strand:+ start:4244 stop:5635 length:1392 start_codon:yes stop_codon:yes gene_type:complete